MTGKQLRNSILQWAIQGKLVPQDPNDEPASVLLERIRAEKARLIKEKKIKKDKNETIIYRGEDNSYYEKTVATGAVRCIDSEIPFDIPNGWEWCRLRTICKQLTDGTHNTPHYTEYGIPFISVKDMSSGKITFSNTRYISFEEYEMLSARCNPEKGDLLLSKVGTTGIPALVVDDRPFSIFVSLALIKFFNNEINTDYLIHLINSPLVQEQAKANTRGVGNKNWVLSAIADTLIVIPSKKQQKYIVEFLNGIEPKINSYNELSETFTRLNTTIKNNLSQAILQEAIQGRLVPQIDSETTAEELLAEIRAEKQRLIKEGKLKKSALANESHIFRGDDNRYYEKIGSGTTEIEVPFEIPSSWQWCRISTISILIGNKSNQILAKDTLQSGLFPVVSQGKEILEGFSNDASRVIGDVPIVLFGDHTKNVKYIDFPFIIGADGTKIHKPIKIHPKYLYYWMLITSLNLRNRGYARHYTILCDNHIPLPPLNEQHRIVAKIEKLFDLL